MLLDAFRKYWVRWVLGAAIAVSVVAILICRQSIVRFGVQKLLSWAAPQLGLSFIDAQNAEQSGFLIILENVQFGPVSDAPRESETWVSIQRAEIKLRSFADIWSSHSKFIEKLTVDGAVVKLDFRTRSMPPSKLLPSFTAKQKQQISDLVKHFMPETVYMNEIEVSVLGENQIYHLGGVRVHLVEHRKGAISIRNAYAQINALKSFANNVEGQALWKDGVLCIYNLPFDEAFNVSNFIVDLLHPGGVSLFLEGTMCGGWFRTSAVFDEQKGKPFVDATLSAQGIPSELLGKLLDQETIRAGVIQDLQINFAGVLTDASSGEGALHLAIDHIDYGGHLIDEVEIGLNISNQLLTITKLDIVQQKNVIKGSGHMKFVFPVDWTTIDYSLQLDAQINDIDDFAGLAGDLLKPASPINAVSGEATLKVDVNGTGNELFGAIGLQCKNLAHDQTVIGDCKLEAVLNGDEAQIEVTELKRKNDFIKLIASLNFHSYRMRIDDCRGSIGGGLFSIGGEIGYPNFNNLEADITFKAQRILLIRTPNVRLRSDVRLRVRCDNNNGSITGQISFRDGRIYKRLEITPLLISTSTVDSGVPLLLPDLKGHVPRPFCNWQLDVTIYNASPFLIVGNIASGSIDPNIKVLGSLGDPRLRGSVALNNVRAYLPASTLNIAKGHIYFRENNPRDPLLDIKGSAEIPPYLVQLYSYGALHERNLILHSDPPLPQESILRLLTTGFDPGMRSGIGEAAAGQGALLVLRTFARQFETRKVDMDSIFNRFQVHVVPSTFHSQSSSLRGDVRLTDRWHLMLERDSYGFLNSGISYIFRFK